jgi:hypothetical protein
MQAQHVVLIHLFEYLRREFVLLVELADQVVGNAPLGVLLETVQHQVA